MRLGHLGPWNLFDFIIQKSVCNKATLGVYEKHSLVVVTLSIIRAFEMFFASLLSLFFPLVRKYTQIQLLP